MVDRSKNLLSEIIKNFNPEDEKQTIELKKILNSYPYFQFVSAYLLKTLKIQRKESFNELLPKTALLSNNRKLLRDWLYSSQEKVTPENSKIQKYSFLDWFDIINDEVSKVEKKIDLIDEFIKNSPKIEFSDEEKTDTQIRIDTKIKDELITETLAKIYVTQKKFNKAIKAYHILSLKYPKKSSFFADQIIYIKKIKNKD